MTEPTRVPTDMEAKLLLRQVARRMEDEATIGEAAQRRPRGGPNLIAIVWCLWILAAIALLPHLGVPFTVWAPLLMLAIMCAPLAVAVARLSRVTAALARMAQRELDARPLPRAPSPPSART
jgi:membrane protein YqaA with SNARE-associated domain